MKRLELNHVLVPGSKMITEYIDLDAPENLEIKGAFDQTRESQLLALTLKEIDPALFDMRITI